MHLVDSSAWIAVFRKGSGLTIGDLVADRDDVVTCLPVVQEVLQGFDEERAFQVARRAFDAMLCLESPLTVGTVDLAVDIYRRARRAGVTPRSSIDCLIAACAMRHLATVVHCDRDYARFGPLIGLRQVDVRARVRRAGRGV